jgi:2-polyprenyl-3-methyl-5-hydroxy-6-metoxy-1,4-benzoquinol methylase
MAATSTYLLDNAQAQSSRRMQVLEALFDAHTRRALDATGLAAGWNCLEVGGGGGSVARWLAQRAGPCGSVLCTDLDARHIENDLANLRVERHDVVNDELPKARFELIHARLVLIHIPERAAVLAKLVAALKPDGWLVIEDFDSASMLPDSAVNPFETPLATADAVRRYMVQGGADSRFGRTLHGRLRALGLLDVTAEGRVVMFDAHNPGTELMRVNFEQLGAQLVAGGYVSADQLRVDLARLNAPDFAVPSPIMWTVAGRKPLAAHLG